MTALALTPPPARYTPEPVPDDLHVMLLAWNSGSETQRAVALELASDNYRSSRRDLDGLMEINRQKQTQCPPDGCTTQTCRCW